MNRKIPFFTFIFVLIPALAMAVGSWGSPSYSTTLGKTSNFKWVQWTFTGDADSGTVPDLAIDATTLAYMKEYFIYAVETNPGTTGPTDNWDLAITDSMGYAIAVNDLDISTTETRYAPGGGYFPIDGTALTVSVSNTSVGAATAVVRIWLSK
jgi:hypothetical protein